jgi:hypothetical protein
MAHYYSVEFAQRFFQEATHRQSTPSSTPLTITNLTTPQQLLAGGYRPLQGDQVPGINVWVHPSGAEVWLLSRPKLPPPPLPEDPAITEVRAYADLHSNEFLSLLNLSKQAKSHIGMPDYPMFFNQLWLAIDKWNNDISRDKDISERDLKAAVEPQDTKKVEEQVKRLDDLQKRIVELTQGQDSNGGFTLGPNGPVYW